MATRIADTLKQQNNLDTFPVAYGEDIWLDKNKGSGTEDFASIQALYNAGALGGSDIEVTSMPDASASYLNKVLLYVGDTGTYEYGKFYKCVSDGETPPSYSWEDAGIGSDPVDGTTIVKDSSTGELSAVQATQSTKGIVKGGNGTQIGSNGEVNVVDRLEEINALPTATADNLDKCYLLKGTQTGYQTGAIYQCRLIAGSDPAEYEWVLISANPLTFDSDDFNVANDNVELQPSRRVYGGTRAAWNLLSVAEKTKYGATAFTDDAGGEYIDVYSTEEVKTNKVWIDNKPVYRKVLVVNQTISSDTTIPSTIPDVASDYWINYGESYFVAPDTYSHLPLTYPHPVGLQYQITTWLSGKDTIALRLGSAQSITKMVAVLEYTKTTD